MMDKNIVIVPVYWSHVSILKKAIPYIYRNLNAGDVYLVGPEAMRGKFAQFPQIHYLDGNTIVAGMSKESIAKLIADRTGKSDSEIKNTGWYLQQFIKMGFSRLCHRESYIVWDADAVPLRPISFEKGRTGKYCFFDGGNHHIGYYPAISKLLRHEVKPTGDKTFVTEYMKIDTAIMRELLDFIESNEELEGDVFWEKILYAVPEKEILRQGFSEFETYGEFVTERYPDRYVMCRHLKETTYGRRYFEKFPNEQELRWLGKSLDMIGFENWVEGDRKWQRRCKKYQRVLPFSMLLFWDQFSEKLTISHMRAVGGRWKRKIFGKRN